MLKNLLAGIWRRLPSSTRLLALRLVNPRFTVTAAAVIFNEKDQVLLLKHRFRPGSGWGLPGGFLKRGEQPLDALHRELCEEIGLELDQVEIFGRGLLLVRDKSKYFFAELPAINHNQKH